MTFDNELEDKLRQLGDAVAPGDSVVDEVMRQVQQTSIAPVEPGRIRRFQIMHSKTFKRLVPLAIAAAVTLAVLGLWPRHAGNGIVWADVVRQVQLARTAHLRITIHDKRMFNGKAVAINAYLKSPDMMRQELNTGEEAEVFIVNGKQSLGLCPSKKQYIPSTHPSLKSGVEQLSENFVEELFAKYCLTPGGGTVAEQNRYPAALGSSRGRLIPQGLQERDGRKLSRYLLEIVDKVPPKPGEVEVDGQTYYWFDPVSNDIKLVTFEQMINGATVESSSIDIQLNVDLPGELFSTDPPLDYTAITLPPGYPTTPETRTAE